MGCGGVHCSAVRTAHLQPGTVITPAAQSSHAMPFLHPLGWGCTQRPGADRGGSRREVANALGLAFPSVAAAAAVPTVS